MCAFPIASIDELGGGVTVRFEGTQDVVVHLSEEDLACVRTRRVVARQRDTTDYASLV